MVVSTFCLQSIIGQLELNTIHGNNKIRTTRTHQCRIHPKERGIKAVILFYGGFACKDLALTAIPSSTVYEFAHHLLNE